MAEYKAEFIKIPTHATNGFQTMPVEPHKRLKAEEVVCELCDVKDADKIAEGLYTCFPEVFWSKMEPPELRPPQQITRQQRLAKRMAATFTVPYLKWVKAIYVPTGEIVGIAGWMSPGAPVHNPFRRSAVEFYGYKEKMGWSDEEVEEMFKGVSIETWDGLLSRDDNVRKELLGEEGHWFLAPLLTFPEFQGRGVGTKLMEWAIKQADAQDPPQPLYLESAPTARAVYMRFGFKPQSERNFLRRGPAIVRGLEAEEEGDGDKVDKVDKVDVKTVEKETEASLDS